MTKSRRQLTDIQHTPYYHCINRCVRRSFLCGENHLTGKNYEHRKEWVVERLELFLTAVPVFFNIFVLQLQSYLVQSDSSLQVL